MDSPSPARVYDALLGGSHNFEVDRRAAEHGTAMVPDLPISAAANRRFLRRAVTFLVESGIHQFIDLGAGIPTVGNTHEVVQELASDATVAYVDIDAVAVAHATSILAGNDRTTAIRGDVRAPEGVLDEVAKTGLIDLSKPVGLLMVALLHMIPDEGHPAEAARVLRDAIAPGSYVVISHLTSAGRPETAGLSAEVAKRDRISLVFRTPEEIAGFFGDFEFVLPGLVKVSDWRADPAENQAGLRGSLLLGGVARKRG
jgi:hypothetical protein